MTKYSQSYLDFLHRWQDTLYKTLVCTFGASDAIRNKWGETPPQASATPFVVICVGSMWCMGHFCVCTDRSDAGDRREIIKITENEGTQVACPVLLTNESLSSLC